MAPPWKTEFSGQSVKATALRSHDVGPFLLFLVGLAECFSIGNQ